MTVRVPPAEDEPLVRSGIEMLIAADRGSGRNRLGASA